MPAVDNSGLSKLWSRIEEFFSPRGHTHSSATASAPGYMSAEDKAKLDGIDPEAAKVDVDSALSATSENPVQNKVVKAALDGKAASSHSHPTYANQNAFSHVAEWTYVGEECEPGDMIFCNTDKGSAYSAAHFDVVQNNVQEMTAAEVEAICV